MSKVVTFISRMQTIIGNTICSIRLWSVHKLMSPLIIFLLYTDHEKRSDQTDQLGLEHDGSPKEGCWVQGLERAMECSLQNFFHGELDVLVGDGHSLRMDCESLCLLKDLDEDVFGFHVNGLESILREEDVTHEILGELADHALQGNK